MSILTTLADGYYSLMIPPPEGTEGEPRCFQVKSLIDRGVQADFARWHYQRVIEELTTSRELYTDAEYDEERQRVRQNYRNGLYDFKSVLGAELLRTAAGIEFLCSRLMPDVPFDDVLALLGQVPEQAKELLNVIIADSFPEVMKLAKKKGTTAPAG